MEFKLFYKNYTYKPNLKAIKQFKEATNLDLWSILTSFTGVFVKCRVDNLDATETMKRLADVIGFVDAAQLFYCLAKQDTSLSIDEIEDAMFHCGILPSERSHDMSEPYPFVIYRLALDIHEYHTSLAKEEKKPLAHS